VGTVIKQLVTILATIYVARQLSPNDYSIAGVSLAVMGTFTVLTAQGFALALIQRENLDDLTSHSVFWLMLVVGLLLGSLAILLASPIAAFYQRPELVQIIWILVASLLINMLGAVPNALLERALRFKELNIITVVCAILSAITGILLAWLGYGYWALIIPAVVLSIVTTVGAFLVSGFRPKWLFSIAQVRALSPFGLSLLGSNLVLYLNDNGDYLIMSRFWGVTDFGNYYFAFERSRQPFNLLMSQLNRVIFPAFSQIQKDVDLLRKAIIVGTRHFCIIVFPLYVILIGFADPFVPWIFGEQWRPAIPVFQVFSVFAFARAFAVLVPGTLLAINRPQAHLIFNLFRAIVILPTLFILGFNNANILTTSFVLLLIWILQLPFFVGYLFRKIGIDLKTAWLEFRKLLFATIIMAISMEISKIALNELGLNLVGVVGFGLLIALSVFLSLVWREYELLLRQIRQIMKKS
jgi:O-antigen/teichoic acid export membrane protein